MSHTGCYAYKISQLLKQMVENPLTIKRSLGLKRLKFSIMFAMRTTLEYTTLNNAEGEEIEFPTLGIKLKMGKIYKDVVF